MHKQKKKKKVPFINFENQEKGSICNSCKKGGPITRFLGYCIYLYQVSILKKGPM